MIFLVLLDKLASVENLGYVNFFCCWNKLLQFSEHIFFLQTDNLKCAFGKAPIWSTLFGLVIQFILQGQYCLQKVPFKQNATQLYYLPSLPSYSGF